MRELCECLGGRFRGSGSAVSRRSEARQFQHAVDLVTAKSMLLDDELLACVLAGVYTDVDKTMIELQYTASVKQTRSAFQTATHV